MFTNNCNYYIFNIKTQLLMKEERVGLPAPAINEKL